MSISNDERIAERSRTDYAASLTDPTIRSITPTVYLKRLSSATLSLGC